MNRSESFTRYIIVALLMCAFPLLISARLLQVRLDAALTQPLDEINKSMEAYPQKYVPIRGSIFDRTGHLLAGNKTVYEIGVEMRLLRDKETIAKTLDELTDSDYATMIGRLENAMVQGFYNVQLLDYQDLAVVTKLRERIEQVNDAYYSQEDVDAPNLFGLTITPHLARMYPENNLASNLLGFVDPHNDGAHGVEEKFNDLLAGKVRTATVPRNPLQANNLPEAGQGQGLILTIDREIQRAMEEIIDQAIEETGAVTGVLLVSNPKTGEVMAMATAPRLNLNEYEKYAEVIPPGTDYNMAINNAYEIGSVFKVVVMASALDMGAVKPDTVFVDTGSILQGGVWFHNWDYAAHGPQSMTGCLQLSLNVCLVWVAQQMGANEMYHYLRAFGIGRPTGIDLAQESPGLLRSPGIGDWSEADLGTNAFGQGLSATPIQIVTAVSALANRGVMMSPQVVRSVIKDGFQYNIEPSQSGLPIRPETARALTEMLAVSLEKESSNALVTGYRVAGKTGTAGIAVNNSYEATDLTNASFVGYGPVDDPQFVIYVWLQKPLTSPWGSEVAAPVFRQAVEKLVLLLNLPPDAIRLRGATP